MRSVQRLMIVLFFVGILVFSATAGAQVTAASDPVECLPIGDNGVAWASVQDNRPDTTVRLNFRRLHDIVEDVYWVDMHPSGDGRYWGVFPKAEDRELRRRDLEREREEIQEEYSWALWWREKQASDHRDPNDSIDDDFIRERASLGKKIPREWLAKMSDDEFQSWLEVLENEPAEYFVSVHDFDGRQIARSDTRVAEVRDDCRPELTSQERGEAENLTVGETAMWQREEEVFHWLCDGIVTRVDPNRVKREDDICRVCVIAWYKKSAVIIPTTTAIALGGGVFISDEEPLPASRTIP